MKQQIRTSVFETNSSSTHAMAIQNYPNVMYGIYGKFSDEDIDKFNEQDDVKEGWLCKIIKKSDLPGVVHFHEGTYGWQHLTITADDVEGKASYLYTLMYNLLSFEEFDETVKRIEKWLNEEGIAAEFQPYKKLEREHVTMYDYHPSGVELVRENEHDWGYVDHPDEANSFLCYVIGMKGNFYNYLFGDSIIKLGNDNDSSDISLYNEENDYEFKATHTEFYKGN